MCIKVHLSVTLKKGLIIKMIVYPTYVCNKLHGSLNVELVGFPETSLALTNYQSTLRNMPAERRYQIGQSESFEW